MEIGVSEKVDEAEAVVILRLSFPRDGFLFDRNWHANVPRTSADNLNKLSQLKKYKWVQKPIRKKKNHREEHVKNNSIKKWSRYSLLLRVSMLYGLLDTKMIYWIKICLL